jgi:hypothetical protein
LSSIDHSAAIYHDQLMGNDDAIRALVAEADANRRWEAVRAFAAWR